MTRQALCAAVALAILALASGCAQEVADDEAESSSSEAALSTTVQAQGRNQVVDSARDAGIVGEQSNGYMGFPIAADNKGQLRALVADINIKRRAVYTDASRRSGAMTVSVVGERVACLVFRDNVDVGHAYRSDDGIWRRNIAGTPMVLPSACR